MIAACFWTKNDHRLDLCAIRHHKRAHSGPSCSPPDDSSCLFEHKRRTYRSKWGVGWWFFRRVLKVKYPISLSRGHPFYGYLNLVWFWKSKTRSFVKKAPFLWISRARHLADPNLKRLLKVKYAHKCKRGGGVEKLPRRESRNEINGACGGDEGNITTSWI